MNIGVAAQRIRGQHGSMDICAARTPGCRMLRNSAPWRAQCAPGRRIAQHAAPAMYCARARARTAEMRCGSPDSGSPLNRGRFDMRRACAMLACRRPTGQRDRSIPERATDLGPCTDAFYIGPTEYTVAPTSERLGRVVALALVSDECSVCNESFSAGIARHLNIGRRPS